MCSQHALEYKMPYITIYALQTFTRDRCTQMCSNVNSKSHAHLPNYGYLADYNGLKLAKTS